MDRREDRDESEGMRDEEEAALQSFIPSPSSLIPFKCPVHPC
jgi:hypothetical protein